MRCSVLIFLLIAGMAAAPAGARMYQWVNPETGTVQLSGNPPSWYRGPEPGPRVLVYEKGQLVDDTAIPLPDDRRSALRTEAFRYMEQRSQEQALKRLGQASQREEERKQRELRAEAEAAAAAEAQAQPKAATAPGAAGAAPALDRSTIDQLKSIISEWDRQQGSPAAAGAGAPGAEAAPATSQR